MKKIKIIFPPPLVALMVYTGLILLCILSLKYFTLLAAPIFFSLIIAYLFNPLVNFLEKKFSWLSRTIISAVLMIILVFVFLFLNINLFPYFIDQVKGAAEKVPQILKTLSDKLKVLGNYINKNFSEYIGNIDIMSKIEEILSNILADFSKILLNAFSSLYGFVITLLYLVLIPLFSYYFIKDYYKIKKNLFELFPKGMKDKIIKKINKMDDILSSFIRGQAIVVLILALLYSLGLSLIGLPFAILIGIFSGIGDLIPYFGTVVGLIISLIIGFAHFQSVKGMLLIIMIFAIVKGSENWFFYPKIVGKEVGLHFVWVLFSIILFGQLFGFWGLVFAIPSSAGFKVFISDLLKHYKKSRFYKTK